MFGDDISRRGFLELTGASALAALGGGDAQAQLTSETARQYDHYGVLVGPESARPSKERIATEWDTYNLVYFATDSGAKSYIRHDTAGWNRMATETTVPTTQVDEVLVEDIRSQFNHTFNRPNEPNALRWNATNVSGSEPDAVLTGTAELQSTARGNYAPGSQSIAGMAFRLTGAPGVGESATAGYYTADDGMLVGVDENGAYTAVRDSGTETKVRLDGNENNGTLPPNFDDFQLHTRIVRFPHLFYRGGAIGVEIMGYDKNGKPQLYRVHTFTPQNVSNATGTPISEPNLPIAFNTNSLTPDLRATAAHYEKGEAETEGRQNGEFFDVTNIDDGDWYHLISWRKRTGYDSVRVEPLKISDMPSGTDVKVVLLLDSTLSTTEGDWRLPDQTSTSESAVEVNTNATISTDGERRWVGVSPAGSGNTTGAAESDQLNFNLPVDQVVTLAAQSFSTSSSAEVEGCILWEEFF